MTIDKPSISVLTVCKNAADTVSDCLDSVAGQSIDAEHIVIDGASTDGTVDVIKARQDSFLRWISEPDEGMYYAMNKGIGMATGDVVGILNSDDYYASLEVLANVQQAFLDPEVGACYGDLCYVDRADTSRIVRYWRAGSFNPQQFYSGWMPPHPTFFVRRAAYEKYGLFDPSLGSAADYEIMLRFLLKHGIKTTYIPEMLVKMRTGGVSNASIGNRLMANKMDRKAWEVNDLKPYPWTLWVKPLRKLGQWIARPNE